MTTTIDDCFIPDLDRNIPQTDLKLCEKLKNVDLKVIPINSVIYLQTANSEVMYTMKIIEDENTLQRRVKIWLGPGECFIGSVNLLFCMDKEEGKEASLEVGKTGGFPYFRNQDVKLHHLEDRFDYWFDGIKDIYLYKSK